MLSLMSSLDKIRGSFFRCLFRAANSTTITSEKKKEKKKKDALDISLKHSINNKGRYYTPVYLI